jgi:hypothetical protein
VGRIAILLFALSLAPIKANTDTAPSPHVVQDPKTKVIFYLESDQHHIAAINPQGKLLWFKAIYPSKISGLKLTPSSIDVDLDAGKGGASLDKKTGEIEVIMEL